jgi:low affinity Fe/Cu permease
LLDGGNSRRSSRGVLVQAWFGEVATKVSNATGSVWTFALAIAVIAGWAISGPVFGFSDTWRLVANTFTTLVTFLMVFLIHTPRTAMRRRRSSSSTSSSDRSATPEERIERETREVEAEKDTPAPPAAADDRRVDPPSHNGKPHNGEPAGQR